MAEQIRNRDNGCRFPGCETKRRVHIHHIVEWQDGGETDFHNLISLCSRHHHLLHAGKWQIIGDPEGPVEFRSENGLRRAGRLPEAVPRVKRRKKLLTGPFEFEPDEQLQLAGIANANTPAAQSG
jgi:hypothetical protein